MSLSHFDLNGDFGSGVYRRRIRIVAGEERAAAAIDDTHHAMWLLLGHDGDRITNVSAAIERGPTTSCGGAPAGLDAVVGMRLASTNSELTARLPITANCTHLGDLLRWTMAAAAEGAITTTYDVEVPDQSGSPVWIEIRRDGLSIHRWLVNRNTIIAPATCAERPLMRGFLAWASKTFSGEALRAAIMLQRGAWVARGRRYIVDRRIIPLRAAEGMEGACHSYSGAGWVTAMNRLGYVRDFTDGVAEHPLPIHIHQTLQGG